MLCRKGVYCIQDLRTATRKTTNCTNGSNCTNGNRKGICHVFVKFVKFV